MIDIPAAILDDAWTALVVLDWYVTRAVIRTWSLCWFASALVSGTLAAVAILMAMIVLLLTLLGVPGSPRRIARSSA